MLPASKRFKSFILLRAEGEQQAMAAGRSGILFYRKYSDNQVLRRSNDIIFVQHHHIDQETQVTDEPRLSYAFIMGAA